MAAGVRAIAIETQTVVVVFAGIIVVGMAAGAIRLVGGRGPADDFRITSVTPGALEVAAVIQRFEQQPAVHEGMRHPEIRRVAVVAGCGSLEVAAVLTGGRLAVVAAGAGTGCDAGVIESRRQPCLGGMAGITLIRASDVVRILARGALTIVTAFTGTQHLRVIHGDHRLPEIHGVAVFADVRRGQVLRGLSRRIDTVVAADATGGDAIVIEDHCRPADIGMADIAFLRGLHVIRRHPFGELSVVTARA